MILYSPWEQERSWAPRRVEDKKKAEKEQDAGKLRHVRRGYALTRLIRGLFDDTRFDEGKRMGLYVLGVGPVSDRKGNTEKTVQEENQRRPKKSPAKREQKIKK